jgi:hypothetical protein
MAVFYKIVKLVKNGVLMIIHIYAKVSHYNSGLDNQTIKKDKKYKFTPLEKRFIKIYLLLAVFYSIVSVYLIAPKRKNPKKNI